jgi:hypothetical protein
MLHPVLQVGIPLFATEVAVLHCAAANEEAPGTGLNEAQHQSQLANELWIYDGCERALRGLCARAAAARDKAFSERGEGA